MEELRRLSRTLSIPTRIRTTPIELPLVSSHVLLSPNLLLLLQLRLLAQYVSDIVSTLWSKSSERSITVRRDSTLETTRREINHKTSIRNEINGIKGQMRTG